MLTTILRSSTTRGSHFRKTSKYSYSVWRSVKNDDTLLRTSTNNLASSQNGVHDILINFNCSPYIKNCSVNRRLVSTSSVRLKEASSKVEQTVERLKDKVEEKESLDNLEKKIDSKIVATTTDATTTTTITTSKKSLWVRIKDEGKHFWSGCKLLVLDVRVCSRIIWKITRGKTITRRERRQLTRTAADLFRLVPFSVFVLVPFMELLLPVALKLFPGMLPSTFTTPAQRQEKLKKNKLKVKLEYTKLLQETLDELGPISKGSTRSSKSAKEFVEFYQELKDSTEDRSKLLDNDKIMKYAKLFEDDVTLDNMDRKQLSAICKSLNLIPIGSSLFLKSQIEGRLRYLKVDDRMIVKEGIDKLSVAELQNANQERGMPAYGLSEERLVAQLGEWIDLSLNYKVPPSLLLLSRTLYSIDTLIPPTQKIASAISALPEKAASAATAVIGEREGKIRNVIRLEQIKEEERKIKEDELEKELLEKRKELLEKQKESIKSGSEIEIIESTKPIQKARTNEVGKVVTDETLLDTAPVLTDKAQEFKDEKEVEVMGESPKKDRVAQNVAASVVSSSSLHELKDAIESLGMSTTDEAETLQEIHKELKDYDEDVRELEEIKNQVDRFDLKQSKGARLLLRILIAKERRIQKQLKKATKTDDFVANLQDHEEKIVTIQDLIDTVTRLQETPNQAKVDQIAQVLAMMDADHDGIIKVDEVLKVIELLGEENTEWHAKQIKQIVKMLGEEEKIKVEDSIEDILLKHPQLFDEDDEAFQQDLKALEDLATSDKRGSLEDYVISKEAVKKLDETSQNINDIYSTDDAKTTSEEVEENNIKDENTEVLIDHAEILVDKAKEFEPTPTFPDEDDRPPSPESGPVRLDPVSKPKSQPSPTSAPTPTSRPTNDTSPNSAITDENKKQLQENGGKTH